MILLLIGSCSRADVGNLQHLFTLLQDSDALVCIYDPDDRVSYANRAFRSAFFLGEEEMPVWHDLMRRNHSLGRGSRIDAPDFDAWLASTLSRRAKVSNRSFDSDLLDGRWLRIYETTLATGWGLFIAVDITNLRSTDTGLRMARDLALRAAQTDELTGISNRRHIMSMLEALIAGQTSARSSSGCICALDIDHFKRLNDTYGHSTGDDALVAVARLVRRAIPVRAAFGRTGGEEFMLILPEWPLTEAVQLIEDILRQLRDCRVSEKHPDLRVSCSAGLTSIGAGDDVRSVYSRADRYLYDAKKAGRDRLVAE